jgi:hypothetical protein
MNIINYLRFPAFGRLRPFFAALLLGVALSTVLPMSQALSAGDEDMWLRKAIADTNRTPRYAARDKWRHPYEVLRFFGLRDNQTVVENLARPTWLVDGNSDPLSARYRPVYRGTEPESQ